ncbi:MAG: alpha/beta fold hydrolase [Chloroflexi bacterium]|nr:MAG: alpha/beta fold hydrolase [Chloroflexota bacterium]
MSPERTIAAGGVRTYVAEHGDGEPLLLLHGGFETADMLPFLTEHLARQRHVFSPERRGHGRTPDVTGPITYQLMARDTLAVMDALHIEAADIVGYSDGANIGLLLALAAPERVRRLVLISGNFHANGMTEAFRRGMRTARADSFEPSFAEAYRTLSPDGPDHWPEVFAKLQRMMLEEPTLRASDLEAIETPTLVLAGDSDYVTVTHTVEMFEAIPNARLCIVPGGSHGLLTEQPALTTRVILDFLAEAER